MSRSLVLTLLLITIPILAAPSDVRIITNPEGSEVWLGPLFLGTTTKAGLLIADVTPGTVTYLIRKNGYLDLERSVQVGAASETLVVVVALSPADPQTQQQSLSNPPSAQAAPQPREESPQTRQPQAQSPVNSPAKEPTSSAPKKGSHTAAILLGVGGIAAAGAAVLVITKKDPLEVDDDRDGSTEKQGDCNDRDPQIRPGGAFSIRVTADLSGSVNCNTPFSSITVFATNLDCSPVTVSSVTWNSAHTSGSECFGGNFTAPIQLTTPTVASGTRDGVIATRTVSGLAGCCTRGNCGSFDTICGWTETYSVVTNRGTFSQPNNYTITFPRGFSCQACTGGASLETRACVPFLPDP